VLRSNSRSKGECTEQKYRAEWAGHGWSPGGDGSCGILLRNGVGAAIFACTRPWEPRADPSLGKFSYALIRNVPQLRKPDDLIRIESNRQSCIDLAAAARSRAEHNLNVLLSLP